MKQLYVISYRVLYQRIYGEIKTKGEDMINEINAKEKELNGMDE